MFSQNTVIAYNKILDALADLFSDPFGLLLLVLLALVFTWIVLKRNHLDKRRALSNILQVVASVVGWVALKVYFTRESFFDESALLGTVFTVVLGFIIVLSILAAAAIRKYASNPIAILRAQLANFLINLAESVADKDYHQEQLVKAKQVVKSIDFVAEVLAQSSIKNSAR